MVAQHTPGPWGIDPAFPSDVQDASGNDICVALREDLLGTELTIPFGTPLPSDEAGEANARLIAAAPELLEDGRDAADMLDMLLRCWVEGKQFSDEEGRQATAALMRLNATIAKATGAA